MIDRTFRHTDSGIRKAKLAKEADEEAIDVEENTDDGGFHSGAWQFE